MTERTRKNRKFSDEFKAEAVAKSLKIGSNLTCKELGLASGTLRGWLLKAEGERLPTSKKSYEELEQEVLKLRKEVGYINEINRILKKSTAIFSASEMVGIK